MSQPSEDRAEDSAPGPAPSQSARILPFERPQSELQRAIQLRAQEAMDIERDREREANKPHPLRWIVIFLIALIPVVLIFGAVDGFLRAFYRVNETFNSAPAPQEQAPGETAAPQASQPGVVILQSYDEKPAEEAEGASAQKTKPEGARE
jgi:hypothetical protein